MKLKKVEREKNEKRGYKRPIRQYNISQNLSSRKTGKRQKKRYHEKLEILFSSSLKLQPAEVNQNT